MESEQGPPADVGSSERCEPATGRACFISASYQLHIDRAISGVP